MTERVYEGRGEGLSDARMSWIDGAAADDMRLSGLHWRLLAHIGRQNARRGWLRLSQTELAEAWDVARGSINRAVGELVAWGYILKRGQDETGEAFCTYKTRLDGDAPGGSTAGNDRPADGSPGQGVSRTGDTPPVSHTGDTGVTSTSTRVSRLRHQKNRLSPTIADPSPPTPSSAPAPAVESLGRGRGWIDEIRREGHPPLVVAMLASLAEHLADWRDGDPRGHARQICRDLATAPPAVLDLVADQVRSEFKHRLPPVATVRQFALAAEAEHARQTAEAARLAALPACPIRRDLTAALFRMIAELSSPVFVRTWFQHSGVVEQRGRRVRIVSPVPPTALEAHASGVVRPAVRAVFGDDAEPEFVRGRAIVEEAAA